jgi:hypothetical protein
MRLKLQAAASDTSDGTAGQTLHYMTDACSTSSSCMGSLSFH